MSFTCTVRSSRNAFACSYRPFWISSSSSPSFPLRPSSGSVNFSSVSRRNTVATPFSRSRGPISSRTGTPFSSPSLHLKPGLTVSRSSSFTRYPAAFRSSYSTPPLCAAMGRITAWIGATFGGSRRPRSSPWVMMIAPISRVLTPQLVSCTYSSLPSLLWYWMSNASAKFVPKLWLVPACSALPSCIIASML